MAATTKLTVFNDALRELGGRPLTDLVTTNTALTELNNAFPHAVEYVLSRQDWNFARRRATLTGVSDSGFPPYTYRYAKPSDYLRKCWVKQAAPDAHQADHAEVGAVFYGFLSSALMEYVSDHADNYDPANWPPHFTRVLSYYLALLTGPKLARHGAGETKDLWGKVDAALSEAQAFENVFLTNQQIPAERQPVFRRALEFLGQELAGSVAIHSQGDKLRWAMNQAWDHSMKYVLEQGAWNFATRRAMLMGGDAPVPGGSVDSLSEGYSVGPATDPAAAPNTIATGMTWGDTGMYWGDVPISVVDSTLPDLAGFTYGFRLPDNFLHKIWMKADASHELEIHHQFLGDAVYTNEEPCVMEYIGLDDDSTNPRTWSATFLEAVAAYLALTVTPELVIENPKGRQKVTALNVRDKLDVLWHRKLSDARLKDAIQQEPYKMPLGRFARGRMGSVGSTSIRRYN